MEKVDAFIKETYEGSQTSKASYENKIPTTRKEARKLSTGENNVNIKSGVNDSNYDVMQELAISDYPQMNYATGPTALNQKS